MNKIVFKIAAILLVAILGCCSYFYVEPIATDVNTHAHEISQIDNKISVVMRLTAASAGASAVISLLPDDQCTPIANQLAELGQYFLIVLSALYLEKYLVGFMGIASFQVIIPLACFCLAMGILFSKKSLRWLSVKLAICAMLIYMIIPASIYVSDYIYMNFDNSIEETIESAQELNTEYDEGEEETVIQRVTTWISTIAESAMDYVSELLSNFVEALAIMIVTCCLIPIVVIVLFWLMVKLLFAVDLSDGTQIVFPHISQKEKVSAAGDCVD